MSTKGKTTGKHGLPVLTSDPYADLFPGVATVSSPKEGWMPAKSSKRCPKCGARGCFTRKTEDGALYRCGQCRQASWPEAREVGSDATEARSEAL